MKQYTQEELIQISRNEGWTLEQVTRGYEIFSSDYMNGAEHIERLDCVMIFETDREASEQAEKDGIKIIHDLPLLPTHEDFGYFIDTIENRKIIKEHLASLGIKWE